MRPLLTLLLLVVFTSVHGLPLKALGGTAFAAVTQPVKGQPAVNGPSVGHPAGQWQEAGSKSEELSSGCCTAELSEALAHTGAKCASDCATLLPAAPVLPLPGTARVHEDAARPIMATAPPVSGHPPQSV